LEIPRSLSKLLTSLSQNAEKEEEQFQKGEYNQYQYGSLFQKERLALVADYCADKWSGEFVEIGCFKGASSQVLCKVAQKYSRKLICIDPWEVGTQNCEGEEYETFLEATKEFRDVTRIMRMSSLDERVIQEMQNTQLSFGFVDGLHTFEGCSSDIRTLSRCAGIIAVDDLSWNPEVRKAFFQSALQYNLQSFYHPIMREAYLWRQG